MSKVTRLLIVEDSVVSAVMMEAQIHRKKPDCEVKCCLSLTRALEYLKEFRPDIVILDLDLPDSAPPQTVAVIPVFRQGGACVIAMTGHDGYEAIAREHGANDFMEKAIGSDTASLIARINKLIPSCPGNF